MTRCSSFSLVLYSLLLCGKMGHAASVSVYRSGLNDPTGWEKVGSKNIDGVGKVETHHKQVADQDCLMGTALTSANPEVMLSVVADIPGGPKWSSWDLVESAVLSENPLHYYQVLNNPWPVSDRAWFLLGTISRTDTEIRMDWEHFDAESLYSTEIGAVKERHDDVVLTGVNVGAWVFQKHPSGQTQVLYLICSDPGGSLPAKAAEFGARTTLPVNVADLIRESVKRQ